MKKNICKQAAAVILSAAIIFGTAGCGDAGRANETSETESTSEYEETERVLVNHMTEKELAVAEKTEFMLLDKPWESIQTSESYQASESDASEDYSDIKDKILYCEGIGAIVHCEPVFNALPPKGYDGGAGTTYFGHFDSSTNDNTYEEISFDNLEDAKKVLRKEYDEEIANGYPKVPADENYELLIALYGAVVSGDYEEIDQAFLDEYLEYYYGTNGGVVQDSDSMYWEMDDEKVAAIKDNISEYHLYDEELDIRFVVHVTTPPDYDKERKYPALVMTDAVWRFNDVTALYGAMAEGKAEPQILITIGFAYDIDSWDNEVRGNILCDHKKEFLDFITDNMMPYLNGEYGFDYDKSTLFGHSQGGVFTHYAAFNYDRYENQPFMNYIIGSPTFWTPYFTDVSDYEDYKKEYGYFERNSTYDRNLFIAAGDMEDEDYEEYYGDNDSTLEGVEHLTGRLDKQGVTTYKVKIYQSHHYQYVPDLMMEYLTKTF